MRYGQRTRDVLGGNLYASVQQWNQRSLVKSIQTGTVSLAAVTSNTATITAVVTGNCLVAFGGSSINTGGSSDTFTYISLTNSTTVTAVRSGGSGTVTAAFTIIEFVPGVIKSNQAGTIALATVASNTATITAVNTSKATVINLGNMTDDSVSGNGQRWTVRLTLTNATTVTATHGSANDNLTASYQVVEFF